MRKVKIMGMIMAAILSVILVACTDNTQDPVEGNYTVTILNHSEWSGESNAEFYDLTGKKVAEAPITSGKATADLSDGTYIVQIAGAPESVSYQIVLLNTENRMKTIELTDSQWSINGSLFEISVIVLHDNSPLSEYQVNLCYEPESGDGGYCLFPDITDSNGQFFGNVNEGRFHLSIATPDGTESVYDDIVNINTSQRFIITEI